MNKDLDKYKNIVDRYDSLYTIIVYNTNINELVDFIYHKLEKIKIIKNIYKRKHINDRLYFFKQYIDDTIKKDKINSIFLLGKDIIEFELTKSEIKVLSEYNIKPIIFKSGEYFDIDYVNNLLTDFTFYTVIHIMDKNMKHIVLNSTKKKIINEDSIDNINLDEYISQFDENILHRLTFKMGQ